MRNIYFYLFVIITTFLFSGCLGFRELPVEYDYSYNGRFKKYKTFDLMQSSTGKQDTTMYNPVIESTVLSRMKFLGYRQNQRKPDLLIAYKIFYDSLNFKGYEQPEIEQWVERPHSFDEYNSKNVNMKTGSLLIQLYDRRQEKLIWNGYATHLYGSIEYKNQRQLRNAVVSILDKYRFFADGYLDGKVTVEEIN